MDSGDLFASSGQIVVEEKDLVELKVNLYTKSYNLMGYDAFTPGEIDLSLGVPELLKKSKQAQFTILLANLLESQSQKPVFTQYLVKEIGGLKIGLLGVISDRFPLKGPSAEERKFYLADPIAAARAAAAELKKKKCELIIAVAHMEENEQVILARSLPEVQFILSGHVQKSSLIPLKPDNAPGQILFAGSAGEYLGRVDFFRKEKEWQSRFQLVPLSGKYPDDSRTAEWVGEYKTSLKKLFQTAREAYSRKETYGPSSTDLLPSFVGDKTCLPCHPRQHQAWQKTGHSRAYQTLARNNRSTDVTCLPCHTTGFKETVQSGELLENVQCEACHGPGRGHPDSGQKFSPVSEKQCLLCHNTAKSPKYHHETYLGRIRCPE